MLVQACDIFHQVIYFFITTIQVIGPYAVSKTALLGLTKALVHQLSPLNIRVNGIAPGIIKTRFSEAVSQNQLCIWHSLSSLRTICNVNARYNEISCKIALNSPINKMSENYR